MGLNRGLTMKVDLNCELQNYVGLAERELQPAIRHLTRGIVTAFDVGAAEGWYALYFAAKTKAHRVFAFEPSEDAAAALTGNLQRNGIPDDRVTVRRAFVGDGTDGTAQLDEFADRLGLPACVKIDVEGAEAAVLDGATRLLSIHCVRWIVETHSAETEAACLDRFHEHGYVTHIIDRAWWRRVVPEYRPLAHNRWLVAVRPGE